jgi:hypothetical protein
LCVVGRLRSQEGAVAQERAEVGVRGVVGRFVERGEIVELVGVGGGAVGTVVGRGVFIERGRHHVEEAEQSFHGVPAAIRVGRLQLPADADERLAEQHVLVGAQRRGRHGITQIVNRRTPAMPRT